MTVAVKNEAPVVVPSAALRRGGFRRGQVLEVKSAAGVVTIVPKVTRAGDDYSPAERRAINRGIAQSEKEYRKGKNAGPFNSAEEFLADLHRETAKLDAKKRKHSRK